MSYLWHVFPLHLKSRHIQVDFSSLPYKISPNLKFLEKFMIVWNKNQVLVGQFFWGSKTGHTSISWGGSINHQIPVVLKINEISHFQVNCVVMKDVNDQEILDFVELTRNKNVHVRFIEYMPFSGNKWNFAKLVTSAELIQKIRRQYSDFAAVIGGPNDTSKVLKKLYQNFWTSQILCQSFKNRIPNYSNIKFLISAAKLDSFPRWATISAALVTDYDCWQMVVLRSVC